MRWIRVIINLDMYINIIVLQKFQNYVWCIRKNIISIPNHLILNSLKCAKKYVCKKIQIKIHTNKVYSYE